MYYSKHAKFIRYSDLFMEVIEFCLDHVSKSACTCLFCKYGVILIACDESLRQTQTCANLLE